MINSKSLFVLAIAAAIFAVAYQVHPFDGSVMAASHTATRSFSPSPVQPGGTLTVTVNAEFHADHLINRVVETLPDGFVYGAQQWQSNSK